MSELKERLQPSLLDRLTDTEPTRPVEARDKWVLSPYKLRESVQRDLGWLFNTTQLASMADLSAYPETENSTINYGLPDLAGKSKSNIKVDDMARALKEAIWAYEPRLIRHTVRVTLVGDPEQIEHNNMCFSIQADMWAQPVPLRLFLRTELDLENGEVRVTEGSGPDG